MGGNNSKEGVSSIILRVPMSLSRRQGAGLLKEAPKW